MNQIIAVFAYPDNCYPADRFQAQKLGMKQGDRFLVTSIEEVASARTEIGLAGIYGQTLNSSFFDFVDELNRPVDIYALGLGRRPEWKRKNT